VRTDVWHGPLSRDTHLSPVLPLLLCSDSQGSHTASTGAQS
jgi:hypothetical protein